jgi:hypothetical protein
MAFAYSRPTTELSEIVASDAFLEALNDRLLRVRVLEHEPSSLNEALKTAIRLEAIDRTGPDESEDERHWGKGKQSR